AEDGLRLQCQGLVPLRDVDGLPLQIQIGTVELRFPAETSAPRIAEGQTGGLARSEVQAPVERPLLAEGKERLRFRGERRPRAAVRTKCGHRLRQRLRLVRRVRRQGERLPVQREEERQGRKPAHLRAWSA